MGLGVVKHIRPHGLFKANIVYLHSLMSNTEHVEDAEEITSVGVGCLWKISAQRRRYHTQNSDTFGIFGIFEGDEDVEGITF